MSTRRSIRYSKTPVHTASKSGTETYLNTVLMCEQNPYKCDRNVKAIRHSEGINCEQYLFSLSSQALVHLAGLKLVEKGTRSLARINIAVAIWPVTGQGFQNTKWPAVLYSQ